MRSSSIPELIVAAAERLSPAPVQSIEELRKGANNRIFRVTTAAGAFALKKYPAGDLRNRQQAEARALEFFARREIMDVPRLIALDPISGINLLSWIEGAAVDELANTDIEQFASFQVRLDEAIDEAARSSIAEAAEACLSGHRILGHIHARLDGLSAVQDRIPELTALLDRDFRDALDRFEASARNRYNSLGLEFDRDLPEANRTLIASDFGAHNALRVANGRLCFVDFEYFGWDDPLTSIGNFVYHPGMQLMPPQQRLYRDRLIKHFGRAENLRLAALLPLFGLRWCSIILNELLPERRHHRLEANADLGGWDYVQRQQIKKARLLLAQLNSLLDQPAQVFLQ